METNMLGKINIGYDRTGNLNIIIPESRIRHFEKESLIKSIECAIEASEVLKITSDNWEDDPARDIVGICESHVSDGSVNHDKYLYGLE